MKHVALVIFVLVFLTGSLLAGTISGRVSARETDEALAGANVYLKGTTIGTATDENGMFQIEVEVGKYTLICDYVGYGVQEIVIRVSGDVKHDFVLTEYLFAQTIDVIADRARERETPVAFSNVEKDRMEARLGSQDIPLVLNMTPSVYATMSGGGAGDARINVRGFNQRNVAIMINGVPVNDMENGWVYWSNWDGVGDATSSIQVQRGLSAVNLATPSIGGTMNVLTDPTSQVFGVRYKQEYGSGMFLKSTVVAHSGLIANRFAVSGALVRKIGDGVIDKTWTDAWAYYFGATWNINDKNRLEFYALGAPQRHGQNSYMQNIGVYSKDLAKDIDGYDEAALVKYYEAKAGREFNQTWHAVSSSYKGKQYWNGSTQERYDPKFINERENYFHKPLVNLNYYTQISSRIGLSNVLYYSGGTGGGTGTAGSMKWDYSNPTRQVDWDATIANNAASVTGSKGILRNSVNNQWTVGWISKVNVKIMEALKTTFGLDWRTAEIDHFREVRDLLGGAHYINSASQFWTTDAEKQRKLGDKMDYDFTNTVDWFGGFGQAEFSSGPITAYGMAGYSMIKYTHENFFMKDAAGKVLNLESDWISGFQVKGGASFRVTQTIDVYGNLGYVSKVPIFDNVISDVAGALAADPKNEKFIAVEGGANWKGLGGKLAVKGSGYYTIWNDRSNSIPIENIDGSEGIVFLTGMDATHMGVELETAFQPFSLFRIDAALSVGSWEYTDNVTGYYKDYSQTIPDQTKTYYVKDLKVGDAPQTQVMFAGSVFPIKGLMAEVMFRYYMDHYAYFNPFTRTTAADKAQSWKTPAYGLLDFNASYTLPFNLAGVQFQVFAHVFNILDTEYIQDATDMSQYNAYKDNGYTHSADDAEVFLGIPRTFNVGVNVNY